VRDERGVSACRERDFELEVEPCVRIPDERHLAVAVALVARLPSASRDLNVTLFFSNVYRLKVRMNCLPNASSTAACREEGTANERQRREEETSRTGFHHELIGIAKLLHQTSQGCP